MRIVSILNLIAIIVGVYSLVSNYGVPVWSAIVILLVTWAFSFVNGLGKALSRVRLNGRYRKQIRREMYADMRDSGVPTGEIESCLNHWNNKYIIIKK